MEANDLGRETLKMCKGLNIYAWLLDDKQRMQSNTWLQEICSAITRDEKLAITDGGGNGSELALVPAELGNVACDASSRMSRALKRGAVVRFSVEGECWATKVECYRCRFADEGFAEVAPGQI